MIKHGQAAIQIRLSFYGIPTAGNFQPCYLLAAFSCAMPACCSSVPSRHSVMHNRGHRHPKPQALISSRGIFCFNSLHNGNGVAYDSATVLRVLDSDIFPAFQNVVNQPQFRFTNQISLLHPHPPRFRQKSPFRFSLCRPDFVHVPLAAAMRSRSLRCRMSQAAVSGQAARFP